MPRPLRVLMEASCLSDARRDAGIGRYAQSLSAAMGALPDVEVSLSIPTGSPWSEARPARFLRAQPGALAGAFAGRPDLVHGLGGEPLLGYPAARQVLTVHDLELWRGPRPPGPVGAARRVYQRLLARTIRAVGAVIAVSRVTAAEAVATLELDPSRVRVVPLGVSAPFSVGPHRGDARAARAAGLHGPFILWVGSLRHHDPRKGLDTLLAAVARLRPDPPMLALVGAGGGEASRIALEARRLGVELVLCGRRDDGELAALYRRAALLALASTHEGFGLTALEAMASGTPVVATSVGNLPDLTGGSALLVAPRDPGALAAALRSVLSNRALASRMRRAGVERAAAFTWEGTARLTAAVYREVVAGARR